MPPSSRALPLDSGGLLVRRPEGLYCPPGDFFVDPLRGVERAVVTHAHADHARWGSRTYLCAEPGLGVLGERVGREGSVLEGLPYGETRRVGNVRVSFHPAGHLLGSAQVLLEKDGYRCVVTGDYKRQPDPTCAEFEPVRCDAFFTECTFGLPVYRWPDPSTIFAEIHEWWRENQAAGVTSVLLAYALGKAQRILAGLDPATGPIGVHGSIARLNPHYEAAGVELAPHTKVTQANRAEFRGRGLLLAPGSVLGSPWLRKFEPTSLGFASGWTRLRGHRRRRGLDRGFLLSDHVDWPDLLRSVAESGASHVGTLHGFTGTVSRYLREEWGLSSQPVDLHRPVEEEEGGEG